MSFAPIEHKPSKSPWTMVRNLFRMVRKSFRSATEFGQRAHGVAGSGWVIRDFVVKSDPPIDHRNYCVIWLGGSFLTRVQLDAL